MMLMRFGSWNTRMNAMVTNTITVRRRRGLPMSDASQPWNWYVSAVTANRKAASSGRSTRFSGVAPMLSPRMRPVSAGTNRSRFRLNSELM